MSDYSSYLQSNPVQAPQPNFFQKNIVNPIKSAFSSGVNEAKQGYETSKNAKNPAELIGGASHIITGVGGAVASPLAPVVQRPIGAAVSGVSNAISDNPSVQNFADSPAGKVTARVAGTVAQTANTVGTIGGAMAGAETAGNIWDKAYGKVTGPSAVDSATTDLNNTASQGVQHLQDMTGSVGDFKNDLGTSFREGATKIEKANPSTKLTLTSEQLDALNTLKNNKSFALPDYLKTANQGVDDISQLHNGVQLTPTQAQDLITQLNKSTFTEKASGLGVDQSKIGLTNEIKSAAKQAFGGEDSPWAKVYSDYAKGSQAVEKISDIVNLDKNATPSDVNKNLNSILNLSKTPQGKIILQNAVEEFKNASGIDLTKGTEAIGQILDKQEALEQASKPGLIKSALDPKYLLKSAVRYGLIYVGLKGIINALKQ